jgi:hypothetical protein
VGQAGIIGLKADELKCVHALVRLLRSPDPVIAELSRQAVEYLEVVAARDGDPGPEWASQGGKNLTSVL